MALEVIWSDEALQQLRTTIEYLENNWPESSVKDFFERLEDGLKAIQNNPNTYKKSLRRPGFREFQVTSHNTIFYTFSKSHINIVSLWSNKKL